MHGGLGILYPIYFCPVGTVLAVSLKIMSRKDCYIRLCTEINLLLISRSRIPSTRRVLRKLSTKKFVTNS